MVGVRDTCGWCKVTRDLCQNAKKSVRCISRHIIVNTEEASEAARQRLADGISAPMSACLTMRRRITRVRVAVAAHARHFGYGQGTGAGWLHAAHIPSWLGVNAGSLSGWLASGSGMEIKVSDPGGFRVVHQVIDEAFAQLDPCALFFSSLGPRSALPTATPTRDHRA